VSFDAAVDGSSCEPVSFDCADEGSSCEPVSFDAADAGSSCNPISLTNADCASCSGASCVTSGSKPDDAGELDAGATYGSSFVVSSPFKPGACLKWARPISLAECACE